MSPTKPPGHPAAAKLREDVRTLQPAYFALVMATGILSIALRNERAYALSVALMWLTVAAYVVLVTLTAWRLARYRSAVGADLEDPRRAFGLFTFVAGTDVLGTRLAVDGHHVIAFILLAAGWLAWLVLGYVVPWTAVLGHARRPILQNANGTWFIWVVASQSIAVLAAALEPDVTIGRSGLALLAVFSWSVGVFLYAGNGVLVACRLLLYPFGPEDLTPPYWVAMGATAITVVAGARIVQMADAPFVAATRGLIAGASVLFWSFGSWLIPPLLAAGIWRHLIHRVPLHYEPTLWSIVFPLGMYGVAGNFLAQADHLPFAGSIGDVASWFAFAAWVVTFAAMLLHFGRSARAVLADS